MEGMWGMFCKASECNVGTCLMHPSSCFNRALFIFLDFVLFNCGLTDHPRCRVISWWQLLSSILNGFIGLVYLFIGIWQWLESEIGENHDVSYPYWWLVVSFHGVTWFIVSLTVSLHGHRFTRAPLRLLSILVFLFSVVNCSLSLFTTIVHKRAYSIKLSVDIFSFLGASLLLLGVYKGFEYEDSHESDLYSPLRDDANESVNEVTPFGKAGFINKMSFWWLNPLMKRGRDAILQEKDVPGLRKDDLAESCYQEFIDLMDKQPSIFWAIVQCHYKEILISGLFAMLKIITLSCGPLVLNAFINVATVRKESFEYEGFVLAVVLFFAKFIESLSQRQWYFRSRLIGLKVKSLLTAAIYKKQLRLSNAAKLKHSTGEIMNYVTVDAYRIGEFPFWLHQTWTLLLQVSLAIVILFRAVGLATIASLVTILLTVLCNTPLAKLQHKFQCKLMEAQDKRLKAISEALSNMKVLKLYAWESHFKNVIEKMRLVEEKCLSTVQSQKAYNCFLFWASPVLVSAATFGACFFLDVPLYTSNVFTFLATLRLVQDPLRTFPDVISVMIQAKTSFSRLVLFLEATELESEGPRKEANIVSTSNHDILIKSADLSWENDSLKPTLRNINLEVAPGQKIAICGEVGSGKSTLLASLLGELPILKGIVQVSGTVAYVSQSAWIQTGSIRDNIIFGSSLDTQKYQDTLEKCSLLDDIELMPYGDLTEIGERGVNLSGGQKQRIQLARSLYREADIYLLDDPFSAVDAHTATDLFNNYVMGALSRKTVLLVTHQVEFLPAFDFVLLMADGNILHSGTYHELLSSSKEFQDLVNAHKNTSGSDRFTKVNAHPRHEVSTADIQKSIEKSFDAPGGDHLIKKEEREVGDTGFKPYVQYLNKKNGFLLFSLASLAHLMYVICQILQLSWMAEKVDTNISTLRLIMVYLVIGFISTIFLLGKCLAIVVTGLQSSQSLFSQLLSSLFRAPMLFYDSTPIGRIISRVSQDLSIVDLDIPFSLIFAVGATINVYSNLAVLAVVTWQVLFVSIPMVYFALLLQRYYFASAKELMRMNGITKSYVANHVAESIAGAMTIRAFRDEHRFFEERIFKLVIIDDASPSFLLAANEWTDPTAGEQITLILPPALCNSLQLRP
ncbi:hypothetical protein Leryth_016243 [Lithospermum erythrorhizon]|nr:hypothetical protein Leryth_016243 [Lithospermum erythrorhizon]